METATLSLVPGPTTVPASILNLYLNDVGSPDLEDSFFELYGKTEERIKSLLKVPSSGSAVIQSGEGMLALWSALKSCIRKDDKVFCIATGIFGYGVADMAKQIGAEVATFGLHNNQIIKEEHVKLIEDKITEFKPDMVTMIHCETPSGTLNPLGAIGQLCQKHGALFYVDFVASVFGVEVDVSSCHIDLGLIGTQKCLSTPPDLSIVTISPRAWEVVAKVNYTGYDALLPWKEGLQKKYFPYTHNWRAILALERSLHNLEKEGLENVFERHKVVARYCRERVLGLGLKLYPEDIESSSPTVTAVWVPEGWTWQELNQKLREKRVIFGGNYGELAGKVFRIGHMGSQAHKELVAKALDILENILNTKK